MKSEKLLRAIGEIDDRFIEEADVRETKKSNVIRFRRRFAGIAASIAVVVLAGILVINGNLNSVNIKNHPESPAFDYSVDMNTSAPVPQSESINVRAENTSAVSDNGFTVTDKSESETNTKQSTKTSGMLSMSASARAEEIEDLYIPGNNGRHVQNGPDLGIPGVIWNNEIRGLWPEKAE